MRSIDSGWVKYACACCHSTNIVLFYWTFFSYFFFLLLLFYGDDKKKWDEQRTQRLFCSFSTSFVVGAAAAAKRVGVLFSVLSLCSVSFMNCRRNVIKKDMKGNKIFCYSFRRAGAARAFVGCICVYVWLTLCLVLWPTTRTKSENQRNKMK